VPASDRGECHHGGMADDDIEALLREVEASTAGTTPRQASPGAEPATRPADAVAERASLRSRAGGALVAGAVAAGGTWLAITFLSGLRWLAIAVAFVVAAVAWIVRP